MDRRHIRDGSQWIDGKKPLTHYSCRGGAEEERVEEERAVRDIAHIKIGSKRIGITRHISISSPLLSKESSTKPAAELVKLNPMSEYATSSRRLIDSNHEGHSSWYA